MRVDQALRLLIAHSGLSDRAVSAALGRSPSWARLSAGPGRDPRTGTLADVAAVAGVDVVLRDRTTGEELGTIEPPRRSRAGSSQGESED